jgi:energy-coupling factor transporter ATPase
MSELIRVAGLHYTYGLNTATPIEALRGIDLEIGRGEYLAIVGHNGSGKSTLAKCLNGLLLPTPDQGRGPAPDLIGGEVWVEGQSTTQPEALLDIRATVGMVFQNPDNQIIASVLEEEVAFGPENLGIPRQELRQRVDQALQDAGLWELRERDPHTLSAGQKARLAIASILAMRPACLVLDESTAMLDPLSRREILALVHRLHEGGLTIVMITHYMDEVLDADRVLVLEQGRIALQGTPREVFSQPERLKALGLDLPPAAAIAQGLRQRGGRLPANILTAEELVQAVTASVGVRP